jgi:hypothetical protein
MTSTTNISVVSQSAPQSQQPTAAQQQAAVTADAADIKPLVKPTSSTISPRIVVDPSAGVIIQFLSSTGQLQNQIPSSTVVAYLRAGLTPEGLSKPQSQATSA